MALSFLTYYLSGFIWGFYTDNFFFSGFVLACFQVFFYFVFGPGTATEYEYGLWLPLSALFGLVIAICLKQVLRAPCFFSRQLLCNETYIIKLIVQLILLHAFLVFWEVLPLNPFAWGGIIQFVCFAIAIVVIYFINKYDLINYNAGIEAMHVKTLYFYWGLFFLPVIALFTIVLSITPTFWPFWLALASFAVSVICLLLVELLIPSSSSNKTHY